MKRIAACFACALLMIGSGSGFLVFDASAAGGAQYKNLSLIPGGVPFGVKFNTEGVVVLGFCDLEGISKTQNPAYLAGLRPKDVITEVNGREIDGAEDLTRVIENSEGKALDVTYTRSGEKKTTKLSPAYSKEEGRYKTGVWVRDSGAGIGTVTYIEPGTGFFGGLGHAICSSDSQEPVIVLLNL